MTTERLKNLLEGDDIERYFGQFVLAGDERAQKIAAAPNGGWENFPRSVDEAIDDAKEIWQEQGLLSPAQLRAALMEKYLGDGNGELKSFVREIELSRDAPEQTTGYLGKEHAYTATGLAHLYALETGKPTVMVEVDFSNMGGTNDYFLQKIAAERKISLENAPQKEAMAMTDLAMRVLCNAMNETLKDALPEGAKVLPLRTGGDELRLLATGIDDPGMMREISSAMHAEIERHVAAMGLQDHIHLKAPEDARRNGFGAALVMQDMAAIENPHSLIQELDARIKSVKNEIGMARLGMVDRDLMTEDVHARINSGDIAVPAGELKDDFIAGMIDRRQIATDIVVNYLHGINPAHNKTLDSSVDGFVKYAKAHIGEDANVPGANAAAVRKGAKDAPAMASVGERRMQAARESLTQKGITPTPAQEFIVGLAVAGLTAQDPSAQVMMPEVLVPTVHAYALDMDEFRKEFDAGNKDVQAALAAADMEPEDIGTPYGMVASFHNLGGLNNLLGHHNSDTVLRHMGRMIEQSLNEAGIPGTEPKPYVIAHNGGACFTVLVRPGMTGEDGKPHFISEKHIQKAEEALKHHVEYLNDTNIAGFLQDNGVEVDQKLRDYLEQHEAGTFADVKDPKMRKSDRGGRNIAGRVPGLGVGVAHHPFPDTAIGNPEGFVDKLRRNCDRRVNDLREKAIMAEYVTEVIEKMVPPVSEESIHPDMNHPRRAHLNSLYSRLPDATAPDMDPEIRNIIRSRNAIAKAEEEMRGQDGTRRLAEEGPLAERHGEAVMMFAQHYDSLAVGGRLLELVQYMCDNGKEGAGDEAPAIDITAMARAQNQVKPV